MTDSILLALDAAEEIGIAEEDRSAVSGRSAPPATPSASPPASTDAGDDEGEPGSSGATLEWAALPLDMAVVEGCAKLDHSDTDNGERLIRHFGRDILVLAQEEVATGVFLGWAGTHWDYAGGRARVERIAQGLGDRIGLEADFLRHTPDEERAIAAAKGLDDYDDIDDAPKKLQAKLKAADAARLKLAGRQRARKAFGVTSKNKGRVNNMLDMAGPRLRRDPEAFNADPYKVACATHTLRFGRALDEECPDPDVVRWVASVEAIEGHERGDLITSVMPVAWAGLDAPAPKWRAFLAEMLPDEDKRRTVQAFSGTSLLGVIAQNIMFHYGTGANGKSVFLETLTRVLGSLAVGLPRESIVGTGDRGVGAASPDLVRLYGRRMVRILEVKGDVPLQEDLIKKLTGGEKFPVRSLFKGYFEFKSVAAPHMSGNGFPTLDGSDYGTMRRILVVHWDQTVPEDNRRDMEEMVAGFVADEGPGILAWLAEGAVDFLAHGLFVAPSVRKATADYGAIMDPVGEFLRTCVRTQIDTKIQATVMYDAYVAWSFANSKRPRSVTKFGRVAGQKLQRTEVSGRNFYMDCVLHDVPEASTNTRNPSD
ncbi:DNA primase [Siculibacillus lacustris]|uniref:DNA primase n=1 Tax=Siculibacillus lacustris TaxID=1549641 RepID=A0A4Q9VGY1_9HYPH|nr:phage/plasmid primase, P4 family [Siculibacillus lacustris]TBW33370.1 DNA primase [Siculibacillus lacustris]